jgi:hypothetical protein
MRADLAAAALQAGFCGQLSPHQPPAAAASPSREKPFLRCYDFTAIFAIFQAISVIFLQKITRYTIDIAGGRVPPTPTATKGANHYADECVFHRQPESRVGKAGRQAARL